MPVQQNCGENPVSLLRVKTFEAKPVVQSTRWEETRQNLWQLCCLLLLITLQFIPFIPFIQFIQIIQFIAKSESFLESYIPSVWMILGIEARLPEYMSLEAIQHWHEKSSTHLRFALHIIVLLQWLCFEKLSELEHFHEEGNFLFKLGQSRPTAGKT